MRSTTNPISSHLRAFAVSVSCIIGVLGFAIPAAADSLFTKTAAFKGTLVSDAQVRYEIGDIITVLVRESVDASTTADTRTKKESDVMSEAAANDNQFFIANQPGGLNILNEEELPNWSVEAENEHRATGSTRRRSTLTMTITCEVTEVLENGNVRLEGKKTVTVNREDSTILVSGIARARDITASNTILSSQIANAQIQLEGKGPLWNNQRRGIFTKILDWFSPF